MFYIQRAERGKNRSETLETVDEFKDRKEANEMLTEYIMSDPEGSYTISTRACTEWKEQE